MKISIEVNPHDCDSIDNAIEVLRGLPGYSDSDDLPARTPPVVYLKEAVERVFTAPPELAAPNVAPSEGDAVTALQAFVREKGVPAAVALLSEFGVSRVTELSAGQRAGFMERMAA